MSATLHFLVLLTISSFINGSPTDLPIPSGLESTTFDLTGRIVNGTKAVLKQFPHQVSLSRSYSQRHFCGGSLISRSLVLTAGHCMYLNGHVIQPWTINVTGGIVHLFNKIPSRQERGVLKIKVHPQFDLTTLQNDIAILELSEPFTFTSELRSVPLPGNALVPNTVCQVAGWGYHSSGLPIVFPDLMYVDLPIRSVEECRKLLVNETDVPPGMFCAGYLEGGRDACQGDSGGGMVCNGILTGTVSGGSGCAEPLLPGVYADVFHYLDWILNETDTVIIVQKILKIETQTDFKENSGMVNISTITMVLISFLFCVVINYT